MAVKDGDISNRARVWAVVAELASEDRHFTRAQVRDLSGLKFSIIDDHFTRFMEEEKIRRIGQGVYELVRPFEPDQAISITTMDDGRVKVEVGDTLLRLNPTETRKIARMLAGWAMQAAEADWKRDFVALMNRVDARSTRTEKQLANVIRQQVSERKREDRQISLL